MNLVNNFRFLNHPLNQEHKLEAIVRFLRWQVGSRIVSGDIVYYWINDTKFIVRPGETGLTGNIYCGLHEFSDMAYVLHVLATDEVFVDIGANVGSYTLLACAVKKAKGYCFEPIPLTYKRLLENIRINDINNHVVALNIGLSDIEGELIFTIDENCTNHVITEKDKTTNVIRVEVSPLDTVLKDCDPHLMKIDVEGFETSVLKGAHNTLKKKSLHSVIMELNGSGNRYNFKEEDILITMSEHGFKPYVYEPFSRNVRLISEAEKQPGNVIFIRDLYLVLDKLKHAPKISVHNIQL
jgi:FkbM family methyltransferase